MNLIERIDRWVTTTPAAIAHRSGNRSLTYGQLGAQANALAAWLAEEQGEGRAPVAVLGHREPEMLVAFLGVVKSGRPYIPIDTTLPRERIDHILALARPGVVLTPESIAKLCQPNRCKAGSMMGRDDPFYIIFTSGSTGVPKGIVITRGCLEHFLGCMLEEQHFTPGGEVFLNQAPFSFDLSVMDLYSSLACGGTLFSVSRDLIADPKLLYRALADANVTTWVSTPSFVEMCLVERRFDSTMLKNVRRFLFCGETLRPATVRRLFERFPAAKVWNFYGPTEATVATTSVLLKEQMLQKYESVPVGRAIPGTEVFLGSETGSPMPQHGRGEIIICGPNVSPGYLDQRDLTAARFFQRNGQRAYRTGDRGRFQDGMLFFEGRIDNQIKLNGYRIELGDVESNLRALPEVRDAVVVPIRKNGKVQWLAGFIVSHGITAGADGKLTNRLRESLRQRIPAYMLPRKLVVLDRLPMTANGKVDRETLARSL